ncbi:hypothetical protein [Haloplanus aerogenes]|uniref:Uncharacterized protein n=1 Tax=Haloplanus aerogenes TaxID=660522 RepID=A0A3M0CX73_9EURY|nr:hypothetical protein [Haloplanus aerogenes]AZH25217.1 hypothetical protein DU502_07405 [Haloplanus aerogenes]RMB13554.1 hypothetical protein ATH50_1993 [Haloplanus aerogenes]
MIGPASVVVALLQFGILATLVEAGRQRNVAAAVNALVALAVTLLPWALERAAVFVAGPALPLWLGVAGLLHAIGMLGPYDSVWWWDHVTHFVSAALVAALFHAVVVVGYAGAAPFGAVPAATVLLTFAAGILWELGELIARELGEQFDIEPVLVHYGWIDTLLDLGFDLVGAVLVVLFDLRVFVPLAERVAGPNRRLVLWGVVAVVVGSVLLVLLITALRIER